MGWDGMGWDAMRCDAMRCDAIQGNGMVRAAHLALDQLRQKASDKGVARSVGVDQLFLFQRRDLMERDASVVGHDGRHRALRDDDESRLAVFGKLAYSAVADRERRGGVSRGMRVCFFLYIYF